MPQTVHKMRQRITKNQLMLVLDSCLNDQEIVGLAKICGIHHSSFPNPEIKNRVICSLCQEFFDQSSIYKKISRVLGKKSKDVIRRIKHMGMDEISMFFGNLDCLRTGDDELGQRLILEWYEKSGKAAAKTSKDLLKASKLAEGEIK